MLACEWVWPHRIAVVTSHCPSDVAGYESRLERCPYFREWYVQASMELGPEDVSLLERCPRFRGWYMYVQASMESGPEDVSLLERCPHFRGCLT